MMPPWLYNLLTVLTPAQGMILATLGACAFFVMLVDKNVRVKYTAFGVYLLGAFGFANAIVGALF